MFIPKGSLLAAVALVSVFVTATSAVSIANQDLERYFRASSNQSQVMPPIEDRILRDTYTYAFIRYQYMENDDLKVVPLGDDQARYGEGRIKSVEGKLVHITDTTNLDDDMACSSNIAGTAGNPLPPHGVPWIALVRRSHCTFEEKVRNVYEKGAIGVIIYNDRDVTSLEKMQIKGKNRDITAVITYNSVGAELVSILNRGMDVTASIIQGRSGERPVNTLNRTSVLFVSVSFIVLMLISLVWLIFYYIQRFRYLQTKDQQSRQLCSVTKKAIMKIPTKTGKQSDEKDGDGDCCAVCIEAYKPTDCIRVLPCKHEFHKNCIDPWLIEHRTCPMCKLDVLKFYGYVFLGSEESILEFDANATANAVARPLSQTDAVPSGLPALVTAAAQPPTRNSALVDLIRSRDFVIDFPRVFVLAPEPSIRPPLPPPPPVLFPTRLPERSQSTLSLVAVNAKDWISQVSNKLDEQQHGGLRRALRKSAGEPDDMQENLLSLRMESVKRRRSQSADGRYSHGPRDLGGEAAGPSCSGRRSLTRLTEASYGQSSQRQREELAGGQDVRIQIQINGEGVDLH